MKSFLLRLVFTAVTGALASCTTYYQNPPGDGSANGVIRNTYRSGKEVGISQSVVIVRMDDLPADYRWVAPVKSRFLLSPGPHRIQLYAGTYSSLLSVPYEVFEEFTLAVRAGRRYRPMGYADGMEMVIWIEDEGSGENVTGKRRLPLQLTSGYGPFRPPPL